MKVIESLLDRAAGQERFSLTESEVYEILRLLDLKTPVHTVLSTDRLPSGQEESTAILKKFPGEKLVIKISSSKTLHKTDSGGVRIIPKDAREFIRTLADVKNRFPEAEGILVCEFVEHTAFSLGQELMLGIRADEAFGPVLTLGVGGTDAESLTEALRPDRSPTIQSLELLEESGGWNAFLRKSWIWRYVSGNVRGGKRLVPNPEMERWLKAFCELFVHFKDGGNSRWAIEELEVNPLAVSSAGLVALDGLCRFRKAASQSRIPPTSKAVWSLLKPSSVAVAGVSEKMNMGRIILRNVLAAGFNRDHLHILKDYNGEIDGVRCYPDTASFPETVDMFVVAVPSKDVPKVLQEAGASGKVRGVVLISGGMGEKSGSEAMQEDAAKIVTDARQIHKDFAVSGGNSLGIVSASAKVNTFFIPSYKMEPFLGETPHCAKTAFISQSGAFIISVIDRMSWLKPAYCVSVGNQLDVTVSDYVEQVAEDKSIRVILAYVEGLKPGDGLRLARTIRRAGKAGKTVIIYKAGRTPTGLTAAMGHTASIAGDFTVARSIFTEAGALVAETFDEFDDLTRIACYCADFSTGQGRVFILSNAGFETVGMADHIAPKGRLQANAPGDALKQKLSSILKESGLDSIVDVRNPLDVTPMANDTAFLKLAEAALACEETDALILSAVPLTPSLQTLPPGPGHSEDFSKDSLAAKIGEISRRCKKPILFCVAAGSLYDPYVAMIQNQGMAVFRTADRAVRAFSKYMGPCG